MKKDAFSNKNSTFEKRLKNSFGIPTALIPKSKKVILYYTGFIKKGI